jgi:hypothetical protein
MKPFSENVRRLLRRGTPFVIVVAAGCPGSSSPAPSPQPAPTPTVTPDPTPVPGVKPARPTGDPFDEPETVPADPAPVDTRHPRGLRQGRPLRVRGKIQRPRVTTGRSWHDSQAPEVSLPERTRERLAAEWLQDARDEHASIAAFARLSLDLLALGAPPELLARTHQAAQDEVEHARACFTLASRYRGEALDPGIFPEASVPPAPGRATRIDRLRRLAQESLEDGCFGEGTAAAVAARAAQGAQDPVVREVLTKIAKDESRHAELGWAVLAWCIEKGGAKVAGSLDLDAIAAERSVRRRGGLEEHGRLGTRAIAAVTEDVRRAVLARARVLVQGKPEPARSQRAHRNRPVLSGR